MLFLSHLPTATAFTGGWAISYRCLSWPATYPESLSVLQGIFHSRTKYQKHTQVHQGEGASGSQPSVTPPSTHKGSTQTGPIVTTTSVVAQLEDPLVFTHIHQWGTLGPRYARQCRHIGGYLQPPADGGNHHCDKR